MAQLKDSIVQGNLRVTDTIYSTDLVLSGSKTKNWFLASPYNASGAPTFRTIVNADLPTVDIAHGGTGISTTDPHKVLIGPVSGTTAAAPTWRILAYQDIPSLGNITNTGTIEVSSGWTLASGDGLVVFDSSNSNKLERTSITFDGTTETQGLTPAGTWINYAGGTKVTFNGNDKGADTASFYAPTSGGTAGSPLIADGTNADDDPIWYGGLSLTGVGTNANPYDATFSNTVTITGTTKLTSRVGIGTDPDSTNILTIKGTTEILNSSGTACATIAPNTTANLLIEFYPNTSGTGSLGNSDHRWKSLYIGTANSYGDAYTPIYWNAGVPAAVTTIQQATFSMAYSGTANTATVYNVVSDNAKVSSDTQVVAIVVKKNFSYLESPIEWSIATVSSKQTIQLTALISSNAVSGTSTAAQNSQVQGYILFRK